MHLDRIYGPLIVLKGLNSSISIKVPFRAGVQSTWQSVHTIIVIALYKHTAKFTQALF